jgi:hypothetical protein
MIMWSAIDVFPTRSIETMLSALASSRLERMIRESGSGSAASGLSARRVAFE